MTSFEYNESQVANYDESVYAGTSWDTWLWITIQLPWILDALRDALPAQRRRRYLDFACGSGRVLAAVGLMFQESWGVDVSEPMLSRARRRVPTARLVNADFLAGGVGDEIRGGRPFDLVTAFRFLLNSAGSERQRVVSTLFDLTTPGGVALFHNHGSAPSARELGLIGTRRLRGNAARSLSHRSAVGLLQRSGFVVDAELHCGLLPRRFFRPARAQSFERVEHVLGPLANFIGFGSEAIYLCRKPQ